MKKMKQKEEKGENSLATDPILKKGVLPIYSWGIYFIHF